MPRLWSAKQSSAFCPSCSAMGTVTRENRLGVAHTFAGSHSSRCPIRRSKSFFKSLLTLWRNVHAALTAWRSRFKRCRHSGDHDHCGERWFNPFWRSSRTDVLSRFGSVRALKWPDDQAGVHHQNREWPCASCSGWGGLGVSTSRPGKPQTSDPARRGITRGVCYLLEGSTSIMCPLQTIYRQRQVPPVGCHGHCPGALCIYVGNRQRSSRSR